MKRKAAIVIGVNSTGGLTPLQAAAGCAEKVAGWLEREGYQVELLTDSREPVTAARVAAAIQRFVTLPARYHQLVVYFSGHGYWHARSDIWLLSDAPVRTDEGINLNGAIELARYSGIPNVVFVSDACRSIPDARSGALMKGIDAFPNYAEISAISKIDVFKATSDARQAYEAKVAGTPSSLLTHALLKAFEEPTRDMVLEVKLRGETFPVVPNRRLERFLQNEVDTVLGGINPGLVQRIEVNVPSDEDVYLARVRPRDPEPSPSGSGADPSDDLDDDAPAPAPLRSPVSARPPARPRAVVKSVAVDAAAAVHRVLSRDPVRPDAAREARLPLALEVTAHAVERRMPDMRVDRFESQCGFSVRGARVAVVRSSRRWEHGRGELLESGDGAQEPGVVRVWVSGEGESVLLRFGNGRGTVLAALEGYIGHVVVGPEGVVQVAYVPSADHPRWQAYEERRERIDRLRALVALAADRQVFRLDSSDEAAHLADEIRLEKRFDPTLGLYAAHAYAQAGNLERVRSVAGHLRDDLGVNLLDVEVLCMRRGDAFDGRRLLPVCPMLTQTWSLLRPRGVSLPAPLEEASAYLCNSLWATFEPAGAELIEHAFERGELK